MAKSQKVTIVSGAARGIGFGITQALAKRGDKLILIDVLFAKPAFTSKAKDVAKDAIVKQIDITKQDQVNALVTETTELFGRVDCLVNAAGVNRPAPVWQVTQDDWDRTLNVNLKGAFLLSRAAAGPMMKQKFGRIVHIGSTSSHTACPSAVPYTASKHGIVGLVRALASDLAAYGITVNTVCPGVTETEMLEEVIEQRAEHQHLTPEQVRADMIRKTPDGRLARPSDIASAILFLTSDEAEHINGQMLTVDGGRSLNLV